MLHELWPRATSKAMARKALRSRALQQGTRQELEQSPQRDSLPWGQGRSSHLQVSSMRVAAGEEGRHESSPGEMKKVLASFLSVVMSRISFVILTKRPETGGIRRKSRILKQNLEPFIADPSWFSQQVIKTAVRRRYPLQQGGRGGMKEQFLCRFAVMGGQSWMQSLHSPVQVEGCNLRIVPLEVREVEEVDGCLLVPGLPGRRGEGRGNGHGWGHPECGLGSKPPLTLCPWCHWRHSQTQSLSVASCWVVRPHTPQPGPHTPPAPNARAGEPL